MSYDPGAFLFGLWLFLRMPPCSCMHPPYIRGRIINQITCPGLLFPFYTTTKAPPAESAFIVRLKSFLNDAKGVLQIICNSSHLQYIIHYIDINGQNRILKSFYVYLIEVSLSNSQLIFYAAYGAIHLIGHVLMRHTVYISQDQQSFIFLAVQNVNKV